MEMKEKVMRFTNMKVKDLKNYLKEQGVKGYSKLKKAELQDMVYDLMFTTEPEPEKPTKEETTTLKVIKPETAQEEIWYNELLNCRTASKIVDSSGETHTAYFKIEADTLEEFNTKYEEIKTKYKKMRAYFHPDRIETGDTVKFRVISKSFEYDEEQNNKDLKEELSKPSKPQEEIWYDEMLETPLQPMALFGGNPFREPSYWCYFVAHVQSEGKVLSKELNDKLSEKMKTKYRKMAKYFHPDMPTGDAEKFRLINKAWEDANIANKEWSEILQKKEEDKISEMTKKYKAVFRQVKLRDEYRWHLYIYDREVDDIDGKNLILDEEIYWDTRVQPDGTYKVYIDNLKYRLNRLKKQGKITEGARRLAIKLAKKFNEMDIKKARKTA